MRSRSLYGNQCCKKGRRRRGKLCTWALGTVCEGRHSWACGCIQNSGRELATSPAEGASTAGGGQHRWWINEPKFQPISYLEASTIAAAAALAQIRKSLFRQGLPACRIIITYFKCLGGGSCFLAPEAAVSLPRLPPVCVLGPKATFSDMLSCAYPHFEVG